MEFFVYETKEMVRATHRPIIIITSNNEKELDAFLRRCFSITLLFRIKKQWKRLLASTTQNQKEITTEAPECFFELREIPGLKKRPSTSELLDWMKAPLAEDIPADAL